MASGFGSLAFRAYREGIMVTLPTQDALSTERTPPYGNLLIVDLGGLSAYHYDEEITVLPADAASWRAALQTTAALTVADIAYGDAVLVTLTNERVTFDRDLHIFSARFLLAPSVITMLSSPGPSAPEPPPPETPVSGDIVPPEGPNPSIGTLSWPCWPSLPAVLVHAATGVYGYTAAGSWLYASSIVADLPMDGRWSYDRIIGVSPSGPTPPTIVWSWEVGCNEGTYGAVGQWPAGATPAAGMHTTSRSLFYAVTEGVGLPDYSLYRAGALGVWIKCWDAPNTNPISFGAGGLIYDGAGGVSQDDTIWVAILETATVHVYRHIPTPTSSLGTGTSVATFATVGANAPAVGLMRGSEDGVYCLAVARVNAVWALYKITASGSTACTGITFVGATVMTELIERGGTWVGTVPGDGLYRSTDDGVSWTRVYVGSCGPVSPGAADVWWSVRSDAATLLTSTDDGATWTAIPYATAAQSGAGTPPVPTVFDGVMARES